MAYEVSVFLENKLGHLKQVTKVLKDKGINILTMSLTDTANSWGILNLIVSDPEGACNALNINGLSSALREILVLEMQHKSGGLDNLLEQLVDANINFTNAYGRVSTGQRKAFLIIDTENIPLAKRKLEKAGIKVVPDSSVYGN